MLLAPSQGEVLGITRFGVSKMKVRCRAAIDTRGGC